MPSDAPQPPIYVDVYGAPVHRRGIVHRDLKPSNLFLRDGQIARVTLLDFGIARRTCGAQTMTRTGGIIGTPEYMSPEQVRSQRDIGPAADIFSLGCVLFECLTGQPPFVGEHVTAVLAKILFEAAPRLRSLRPELPEALEVLLARMLAKEPAQRLRDAEELLHCVAALDIGSLQGVVEHQPQPPPLVDSEQQIVSVIVATPAVNLSEAPTLDGAQAVATDTKFDAIQRALAASGVQVESLVDGSIVATLAQGGSITASDQAVKAARCAILIKEIWGEARIVLATGRGVLRQRLPIGEAIDRAERMLQPSGPASSSGAEEGIRVRRKSLQRRPSGLCQELLWLTA